MLRPLDSDVLDSIANIIGPSDAKIDVATLDLIRDLVTSTGRDVRPECVVSIRLDASGRLFNGGTEYYRTSTGHLTTIAAHAHRFRANPADIKLRVGESVKVLSYGELV